MLTELDKKNFDKWEQSVKKIALSKDAPAVIMSKQPETDSALKVIMNRNGDKSEVYVEYVSELPHRAEKDQFIVMVFKWYPTRLLVEQSLIKRVAGSDDEELSYGATVYTKFSGARIKDTGNKGSMISLLYGRDEELLPIILSNKDARKLMELICSLE